MPPYPDDINSSTFLMGVKDKLIWCPRQEQMKVMKTIAEPPSKKQMAVYIYEFLENHRDEGETDLQEHVKQFLKHFIKSPPSFWWMQQLLSTCCEEHFVFDVNYMPPKKLVKKSNINHAQIRNVENFFNKDNLNPQLIQRLMSKQKKNKRGMNMISAE